MTVLPSQPPEPPYCFDYITSPSHWSIVLTDLFGICCTIALCFKLSVGAVFVDAASRFHKNDGSGLDFVCDDTCTGSLTLVTTSVPLTDALPTNCYVAAAFAKHEQ